MLTLNEAMQGSSSDRHVRLALLYDIIYGNEFTQADIMVKKTKFVMLHHNHAIYPAKDRFGQEVWRTYISKEGGGRRRVQRKTKDDVIECLFEHYTDGKIVTLDRVFENFIDYKKNILVRSENTLEKHRSVFNRFIDDDFRSRYLVDITEDDLRRYLKETVEKKHPVERSLSDLFQLIHAVFRYAVEKGYLIDDVSKSIKVVEYLPLCERKLVDPADEIFSDEELERIKAAALEDSQNPFANALDLELVTGMRAGELVALKWSDIDFDRELMFIQRQQVKRSRTTAKKHRIFYQDVNYTKDTQKRMKVKGRHFPIKKDQRAALVRIQNNLGVKGDYVLHRKGKQLKKDSYQQYFTKLLNKLDIEPRGRNNHELRKTFNSKALIPKGLNADERALLLGHLPETNESAYSFADLDIVNRIGLKLE